LIARQLEGAIGLDPVSVGLVRVGDGPLAMGADATAAVLMSRLGPGARLAFVEMVGSDPVDVADALERAVRRDVPVVVWAAGEAAAEWAVEVCLAARARGRAAVGLPPLASSDAPFGRRIGNLFWLSGPLSTLDERWANALPEVLAAAAEGPSDRLPAIARVDWSWPETARQSAARLEVEASCPQVLQRLVRGSSTTDGSILLELAAPSRSRLVAAERLLRRALAEPRARAHPRNPGPGK
jgi:hypothetical protein